MIKVIKGRECEPGVFEYSVPEFAYASKSRSPLLDACRAIQSMGGPVGRKIGLFKLGSSVADITAHNVAYGAGLRASLDFDGPKFKKIYEDKNGADNVASSS